jgi:hypothetical protein
MGKVEVKPRFALFRRPANTPVSRGLPPKNGFYPNRAMRDAASSMRWRIASMQGVKLLENPAQSLSMARKRSASCSAARQVSPSTEADSEAGGSVLAIAPPLPGANPIGTNRGQTTVSPACHKDQPPPSRVASPKAGWLRTRTIINPLNGGESWRLTC